MAYMPPYTTTDKMVNSIAEIGRLLGVFTARESLSSSPRLRRINRIKSIHSSLAIENNTLSLDEVTAVLDGKRVLAPPKDIHEAQNAYEAYEHLSELDPYSIDDLLRAHGFMMAGLIKDAGRFRTGNVGVFAGSALIHAGTPARYVPEVIADLFSWLRETQAHPLISSSVFHFEFEYIHPFSDGNGRTGRLWQSLLLQRWEPLFAWLPVESLVAARQQEYYDALGRSQQEADATEFVEFMLQVIEETLRE
ncbi:MAG: Fic family protein, partial [Coriobacteriales bacterium]|nr:Fic family protein [Coriobacteriales bacterium]